ncbi:MAG: DNA repair protein RecO [Luteolibacter sp.]
MITTRGILTRLTKLTDTSLIAHWFTADAGLLKTVARGARRPKSPFAGKLDLFFSGEISLTRARRGSLDTLKEVVIENCRDELRKSWPATLMAGYFCQLAETVVEPGHPEPEIFDLLGRALDHLECEPPTLLALKFYEAEIARNLGISEHPGQSESALREVLGVLPSARARILDLLSAGEPENYSRQSRFSPE